MGKSVFWLVAGTCVGTSLGAAADCLPAGISVGAGSGTLFMLLSLFNRDKKQTNNKP